jgi:hypothetical protein
MIRRLFKQPFGIVLLASLLVPAQAALDAQCSCLNAQQSNAFGSYSFRLDPSTVSISQFLTTQFTNAASEWTSAFNNAQSAVTFSVSSSGNIPVTIDDTVCPDWASAAGGQIRLCSQLLAQDGAYISRTIRHEMGHFAGFSNQTTCSAADSVMKVIQPNEMSGTPSPASSVASGDWCSVNHFYRTVRDNDNDGHSPDTDGDCNDDDPNVWVNCEQYYCETRGLQWYNGVCLNDPGTPIIIPVGTNPVLRLTAPDVVFDLNADGVPETIAWTEQESEAAFLALDRNGNGRIDNGSELFGDSTSQPPSNDPNGFRALAEFDKEAAGGNSNGWIDAGDTIYARLVLWRDTNHDGVTQPSELSGLQSAGISGISLDYRYSFHRDRWGNVFRYRSRVEGSRTPWAYDVLLRISR